MELDAAKMIGAGLAAIGVLGGGIGVGIVFGNYFNAAARNPSLKDELRTYAFLGFALSEATSLFALVIALIILFT
jgi:F-type H+-transporting ATPase subunit c